MTWPKKTMLYIAFLLVSLLLLAVDHRRVVLGDTLFRFVGLPPWSEIDQGLHYSAVLGIILTFISGNLVIRHFRVKYKRVARKVVVACILFFILFPTITKGTMTLIHYNGSGLAALDYSKDGYLCSYTELDDIASYDCKIKIYNYGNQTETVQIKPILKEGRLDPGEIIDIKYVLLTIPPRSERTYSISFESNATDTGGFGIGRDGGVSFKQDGKERRVLWY